MSCSSSHGQPFRAPDLPRGGRSVPRHSRQGGATRDLQFSSKSFRQVPEYHLLCVMIGVVFRSILKVFVFARGLVSRSAPLNQDHRHYTEDKQLTENEDRRVKPLSFHQPITASPCDSAESIATPLLESDLDDGATSCSAGFTTVPTGARSKRRTFTSLSL